MIVGIHQPIFFPWIGYFDKMAKSDVFVLLDEVQMEKGSYMYRNRILNKNGDVCYLTISGDKHGYLEKKFNEIAVTNEDIWIHKQTEQIRTAYGDSPYFTEVWDRLKIVYDERKSTICEYAVNSIKIIADILNIDTKIVCQSCCNYDATKRKNDLVLSLCKGLNADAYLSGNGARKYTDEKSFEDEGIIIRYQQIDPPLYEHLHTNEFVTGLSMIDMLFSCGIEKTRELFWENCRKTDEFSR